MRTAPLIVAIAVYLFHAVLPLDNGLARTPPMGWLSWERFGCQTNCTEFPDTCISERLYLRQAQLLVEKGFRDVGYTYVNIDDCWSEKERVNGKIVEDRRRFPNGLKKLSRQLHAMGLKLGLYGDIGTETCGKYPGFEGHFNLDARTLAVDFEVDSIKVDACNADEDHFNTTYPLFGAALNRTERPILYSCSWPNDYYEHHHHWEDPDYLNHGIKQTCNMWRNYNDVFDSWDSVSNIIEFWARNGPNDTMVRAAGPGHWNDPDMLVAGNPGLSLPEQQAQFSLWAIFAAPLMISADLEAISDESLRILQNSEVIAVNQDELGRQGWCAEQDARVWVRELKPTLECGGHCGVDVGSSDSWAVVLQNPNSIFYKRKIAFDPKLHLPRGDDECWDEFEVRDLIAHADMGVFSGRFIADVDESGVSMFKVVAGKRNLSQVK